MRVLVTLVFSLWSSVAWAQASGTWQTLGPETNLNTSAVACGQPGAPPPPTCIPGSLPNAMGQRQSLIDAWTDMAYDPTRKLLVSVATGGHADWAGNQVVAFSLETKTWSILRTYSPNYPTGAGPYNPVYPDGTPASVHSYGCVEYMPSVDQYNRAGGIYWSPGGSSSPQQTAWFNPTGAAWTLKVVRPGGYGCHMKTDPSTGKVLVRLATDVRLYDPATDAYTLLFTQTPPGSVTGGSSLAGPVNGRKYYRLRGALSPRSIGMIDLDNPAAKEQTILTGGATQVESTFGPLALVIGRTLVAYGPGPTSGTGAMYLMDLSQPCGLAGQPVCQWVRDTPPDGIYPLAPPANGVWKRGVYYAPDNKVFIVRAGNGPVITWVPSITPPVPTFPVTVSANPANGGMPTGPTQPVPEGVTVTLTRPANTGFTFTGWSGDPVCADTFTMPAHAVACTANYAPVQVTLTLTSTGSTGAGTLSGAGTYDYGSTVTIGATTMAGSAVGTVSGDQGCVANGPITMNGSKSCNIPFIDVEPPTVTITSPTAGQIVKQTVPVAYSATDNMPGGTTTVLLDGAVFNGTAIDPALLSEGSHTLSVQMVDAAGNQGQAAVTFITVICPVCQASLGLQSTGAGRLAGAGKYLPWTVVEITATPAGESETDQWTKVHGHCPAPRGVQPPRADVTWAYDPTRDQGVLMTAY